MNKCYSIITILFKCIYFDKFYSNKIIIDDKNQNAFPKTHHTINSFEYLFYVQKKSTKR